MYDSLYIHRGEGLIPPPSDFRVKCCFLDFAIATGDRYVGVVVSIVQP